MVLTTRSFGPVPINPAALEGSGPTVLAKVSASQMVGLLIQIGQISEYAADLFHNLYTEATSTSQRISTLIERTGDIEQRMSQMDEKLKTTPPSVFYNTSADVNWKRADNMAHSFFSYTSRPAPIEKVRQMAYPPPAVHLLNELCGRDCAKQYSDPGFFFEQWQREELAKLESGDKKNAGSKRRKRAKKDKAAPVEVAGIEVKVYSSQGAEFGGPVVQSVAGGNDAISAQQRFLQQQQQQQQQSQQYVARLSKAVPASTTPAQPTLQHTQTFTPAPAATPVAQPQYTAAPAAPAFAAAPAPVVPAFAPAASSSSFAPAFAAPPATVFDAAPPAPTFAAAPPAPVFAAAPPAPILDLSPAPPAPTINLGGAPPAPAINMGGAPPAPMLDLGGAPAPPALGGAPAAPKVSPPAMGGRGNLLSAISAGVSLKKVEPVEKPAAAPDTRGGLLADIKNRSFQLKKATVEPAKAAEAPKPAGPAGLGAVMDILARRRAIQDSSDDDDDDDDWD